MLTVRSLLILTVLAATAVSGLYAENSNIANAYSPQINFPPVGVASTQTVQINVVNLAPISAMGSAVSCTGSISFVNSSGAAIGTASSFTLAPGQITSVTLPYTSTGGTGSRVEIRGVVQLTESKPMGFPCATQASLETFDTSSGVTAVWMSVGAAPVLPAFVGMGR